MKNNNELDRRLREWAAREEGRLGESSGLQEKILGAIRKERVSGPVALRDRSRLGPVHFLVAAAVILVAIASIMFLAENGAGHRGDVAGGAMKEWAMSDEWRPRLGLLTERVRELFGERVRWIAETGDEMEIGIDDGRGGLPVEELWVVRLGVFQRSDGDQWEQVKTFAIVTRPEERVRVPLAEGRDGAVAVWLYPLGGGEVNVESHLSLPRRNVDAQMTSICRSDEAFPTAVAASSGEEYQVVHSVDTLLCRSRQQ